MPFFLCSEQVRILIFLRCTTCCSLEAINQPKTSETGPRRHGPITYARTKIESYLCLDLKGCAEVIGYLTNRWRYHYGGYSADEGEGRQDERGRQILTGRPVLGLLKHQSPCTYSRSLVLDIYHGLQSTLASFR